MSVWTHKIDRAGNTGPMLAYFESEGGMGASGANGQGTFGGLPVGIYDAQGNLTAVGGTAYVGAASVPGVNTLPPRMILRVTRDGEDVLYGTFLPIETTSGILNLNVALTAGQPLVVTADRLKTLEELIATAQSGTGGGTGGLSAVSTDGTLTGDGTPANPLHVVGGGGSGGSSAALVRTVVSGGPPVTVVDDFSTNRVQDGTLTMIGGFYGPNSTTGLTYDIANGRILVNENSSSAHFWRYGTDLYAYIAAAMDLRLVSDSAGYQHLGLWVPCSADGLDGYRVASIQGKLTVSRWVAGVEESGTYRLQVALAWAVGESKRVGVEIDFATGVGTLSVGGSPVGTWTDQRFTAGGIGGFSYGCVAAWDNLSLASTGVTVQGLPTGGALMTTAGVAYPSGAMPLSRRRRIDAIAASGAVLASAWMSPGEIWTYQA